MSSKIVFLVWPLILLVVTSDQSDCKKLREKYFWKQIDFDFGEVIEENGTVNGEFIPVNNVPFGIEVWNDKLFVSIPRRRTGIPATVNYIKLNDTDSSPKLKPYPDLVSNKLNGGTIVSVYRMYVDVCSRLWLVDTGTASDQSGQQIRYKQTNVKLYDLDTDRLVREYSLKQSDVRVDSTANNIVVDVRPEACDKAFAYISDVSGYGLVVYDLNENDSWRITHSFFYPDPLSTDYNVGGFNFQWTDGIFGMALSGAPQEGDKPRSLYFHPLSSTNEFVVSTKYLRNRTIAENSYRQYKLLGSRGELGQAASSAFDEVSGVLFYPLINKNAIGCWNQNRFPDEHSSDTNEILAQDKKSMIYTSDLRIDNASRNLWFITNRMPIVEFGSLNTSDVNFRIFTAPIDDLIKDTVCANKSQIGKKRRITYHRRHRNHDYKPPTSTDHDMYY